MADSHNTLASLHNKTRPALLVSFLFLCTLLLGGCSREPEREVRYFSGATMGTTYNITLVSGLGERFAFDEAQLQADIDEQFALINQYMSTYIADSELMQLNRAPVEQWLDISAPMAEVLALSQQVSAASDGAFDITVGPLVNLWGFGPDPMRTQAPDPEQLAALQAELGYQYLELEGQRLRKLKPVQMDLSAVAKGYGVDWLALFLAQRGFENYLVEVGGDLRVGGVNRRGSAWRIAIEQPNQLHREARMLVSLEQGALATSGDYRNYFEQDGVRYSHTIDPNTGYPIRHNLASVTVIAETAAAADAWATALNVLGADAALALAELEQLPVYMILKEQDGYSERASSAFARYQP